MFIEKQKTQGLAHLSYILGSEGEAAVVDPRRDVAVYMAIAAAHNCRITHIFETHRNEDLVSGAAQLADLTGASVYHGPNAAGDVIYAQTTREGETFAIGKVQVQVLETPGHTDDSLSFAIADTDVSPEAVAVFTGDALFVGDVGRVDFYPERDREVAGLLYDSLQKLLHVGDQAVLYPAHGAGSVCGSGMADREVSTIGYERRHNPRLQIRDRDEFITAKLAEHHDYPPYFRHMEALNLSGAPPLQTPLSPPPLKVEQVETLMTTATLVDVRSIAAFLGAHLPGSLALPVDMLAAFAGWLLQPDDCLILVADNASDAEQAAYALARIGYDQIAGFLAPSLTSWAAHGKAFNSLPVVDATTVHNRVGNPPADWTLLDVRSVDEVNALPITKAQNIYVGELPTRLSELDKHRQYTVMCGSGARATVAASVLSKAGFEQIDLFLGSMAAWQEHGYQVST